MQSLIRKSATLFSIVAILSLSVAPMMNTPVFAASSQSEICAGLGQAGGSCGGGSGQITNAVRAGVNILSLVAGIAAVIMIIISGLKFITAQGDASGVASARTSLIYALVGLVVAALAQVIVHFVLSRVK